MKKILAIAFLVMLSSSSAYAEGGHGRGHGWGWGGWVAPALIGGAIAYDLAYPYSYPYRYPYSYPLYVQPYPVYPQTVYIQPAPVYEQAFPSNAGSAAAPSASQYWYFCASAQGYYPYVTNCPEGWKMVPTTPPPPGR
jgi:hypothetical protein